jgi:hypothetical protein
VWGYSDKKATNLKVPEMTLACLRPAPVHNVQGLATPSALAPEGTGSSAPKGNSAEVLKRGSAVSIWVEILTLSLMYFM